jgi:hypothetical protein
MPNLFANRDCVYQTAYHVVWRPKYRRPVLTGLTAEAAREILARICLEKQWPVTVLEIQPDHIHLFFWRSSRDFNRQRRQDSKGGVGEQASQIVSTPENHVEGRASLVPVVLRRRRRRSGRRDGKKIHRTLRAHSRQEMSLKNS